MLSWHAHGSRPGAYVTVSTAVHWEWQLRITVISSSFRLLDIALHGKQFKPVHVSMPNTQSPMCFLLLACETQLWGLDSIFHSLHLCCVYSLLSTGSGLNGKQAPSCQCDTATDQHQVQHIIKGSGSGNQASVGQAD